MGSLSFEPERGEEVGKADRLVIALEGAVQVGACLFGWHASASLRAALAVIASEAKQSRAPGAALDCFVAPLLAITKGKVRSPPGPWWRRWRQNPCAREAAPDRIQS